MDTTMTRRGEVKTATLSGKCRAKEIENHIRVFSNVVSRWSL